jgi:hemolysin D
MSAKKVVAFPKKQPRRREPELAFLPAALEITETPPSPSGRAVGAVIIAMFAAALAWACFGTVDIVATAKGKIIPSGRSKVIQPFETGVVRAIHVRDGQAVRAGEVLIELDPTMTQAELGRLNADLLGAQLDVARLRAALEDGATAAQAFRPPAAASATQVEMHRQFLISQVAEERAKLAEIARQQAQKEAERETIAAAIAKIEATMRPLQERVEIRGTLYNKELGSKLTYLAELQDLTAQQHELLVQQSRMREAQAGLAALAENRLRIAAEYRRARFEELAKAEQKAATLAHDVAKTEQRERLQRLTAPVDGVVQQLEVHTVGGVVTPAQALAILVPAESQLEIEAAVANRDIGFVHAGQPVEVKVDTFNFTRYGLLHGRVVNVSQDAVAREGGKDKAGDKSEGAASGSSEPKGNELTYIARISLERTQMDVDGKLVTLAPGMAVTAEIKTGTRTIISYLLSPIAKYRQEILRER